MHAEDLAAGMAQPWQHRSNEMLPAEVAGQLEVRPAVAGRFEMVI